jgi:hypothetical protein
MHVCEGIFDSAWPAIHAAARNVSVPFQAPSVLKHVKIKSQIFDLSRFLFGVFKVNYRVANSARSFIKKRTARMGRRGSPA